MFFLLTVIPEPPLIMQLEFGNNSITALLHWKASRSSENVTADVRFRSDEGFWVKMPQS